MIKIELEFFICIIDTKLFKTILFKHFETKDIKNTNGIALDKKKGEVFDYKSRDEVQCIERRIWVVNPLILQGL